MTQESKRIIFHIDVNSAFLSWEAVYRIRHAGGLLDLREIPSAVGGDPALRRGIILAKSMPAKKFGIKTGETLYEARSKCPSLMIVPPNYGLYETCSAAFMEILREYTPDVEPYSVDEAYMDMTGSESLWGPPVETAQAIRIRIKEELGFTVNIGVSENKLLAKMASDFCKPDRVHSLFREEIESKMWNLPVSDLFFAGRASVKKLKQMGIFTIGQLAGSDPEILRRNLKKQGELLFAFANGTDTSGVIAEAPPNKGYGNSTTVCFDVADEYTADMVLLALAETVGMRLRQDGAKAEVISVGMKNCEFAYTSHQRKLPSATNITKEIYQTAKILFRERWDGAPVRHLGIHTGRVYRGENFRQINLFDKMQYEKWERLDPSIDGIRKRYGIDSVKRAVFVENTGIDHMSGGVSREKRAVDYESLKIV